jgi:hypothetical protein
MGVSLLTVLDQAARIRSIPSVDAYAAVVGGSAAPAKEAAAINTLFISRHKVLKDA